MLISYIFGALYRKIDYRLKVVAETSADEDFETDLQKLIPDGLIGRFDLDAPFDSHPNRLDGCETFVKVKTLAALSMTPNARAQKF